MATRRQFVFVLATAAGLTPLISWLSARGASTATGNERFVVEKTDEEWRRTLTGAQYSVLRGHGTERPGTSPLNHETRQGTFACAACGHPLFSSDAKFESGTGWPSFWAPLDHAVGTRIDRSLLTVQTEVHCANCGSHLGHVFEDGPKPTGLRYCMNGVALAFSVAGQKSRAVQKATFAGGCFWSTEKDFDQVEGVISTTSGYIGGRASNPTYSHVSSGGSGHAEAVEVVFDSGVVTYEQLLDHYWHSVDPFVAHRQFCDVGDQYRPVIFVHDAAQRTAAEASRERVQQRFREPVLVGVIAADQFFPAEEYHQDYYKKHPLGYRYYRWACGRDARLAAIWKTE